MKCNNSIIITISTIFFVFFISIMIPNTVLATDNNIVEKEFIEENINIETELEEQVEYNKLLNRVELSEIKKDEEKDIEINIDKNVDGEAEKQENLKEDNLKDVLEVKKDEIVEKEEKNEVKRKAIVEEKEEEPSKIEYSSHIQGKGWEEDFSKKDGEISGTEGQDRSIEAIKIELGNSEEIPDDAKIKYQVHVQDYGWMDWKQDGEVSGTEGESKRIEAIRIKGENLEDYSVLYRTNVESMGWTEWVNNGEVSGTEGRSLRIEAIQIKLVKNPPIVEYQTHVQNIGWQNYVTQDEIAGTTGRALGIEAIRIRINGVDRQINIMYQTHVQNIGWQNWYVNDAVAGTTGQAKSIEAIKIELENADEYSIEYRVHISGYGWQKWRKNGEEAGTTGLARRIEAIQMRIVYKNTETIEPELIYRAHVQDYGWQYYAIEGFATGTEGQAKRIEALQINLIGAPSNAKVLYKVHVQDIGWQNWRANDTVSGTTGLAKRIEAIQIKLEGLDDYTVEYKVHIQDYGWSGWMIDGEQAGTTGQAKRIEALQMRIVPKYYRQYYGIDVSSHNGEIDWQAVKNSGVQFAMIRCGYRGYRTGKIAEDTEFENNIKNALASGVKVGLYFFSQALNSAEGVEEANYTINIARKYNITYPIAIDSEMSGASNNDGRADGLNAVERTSGVVAFCDQIRNNGYIPMIYASRDWFYNNLEVHRLSNCEIWLAHYTGSIDKKSNYKYDYDMWQYTSAGSVAGINGNVDLNVGYRRYS